MTKKEFFKAVSNGEEDVIQVFLDALSTANVDYCVIGGLAVNAYAEPVVSLDLAIVVAIDDIETACKAIEVHFKKQTLQGKRHISAKSQNDLTEGAI